MRSLVGKRVLITGAGSGLGRELALEFARAGAQVAVTDINTEGLVGTAELIQAAGGRAIRLPMDVTDVKSVLEVRQQLHQHHGPIDILVNNAGIVCCGEFLHVSVQAHRKTLEVNALGPVIVNHAFLPDLIAQPEGHCVNIVSASAMLPMPSCTTYAASKWAALGLSDSIREELRRAGHRHVGVTAVCPGFIDTSLFEGVRQPRFLPKLGASRLAAQIVRAVQANKPYLRTPWLVKIIPLCRALLPLRVGQLLLDWLGVSTIHNVSGQQSPQAPEGVRSYSPAQLDPLVPDCTTNPPSNRSL